MSFEKQWRRFQKDWKRGRYKRQAQVVCAAAGIVCIAAIGVYFLRGAESEKAVDELRDRKEAALGTEDGEETGVVGNVLPEYQDLFLENPDLVGWVTIEGTSVDYPVMWTPEDPEYYSHRGFDKEDSPNGLLFMDADSMLDAEGGNVIIYGHNMKNGSMFADLLKYEEQEYYQAHPTIRLDTLYEHRDYEIVSVLKTNEIEKLPFSFTQPGDSDEAEVLNNLKQEALYDTGKSAQAGDDLLTLATCDYSSADGRLVVTARRVAQ